MVVKGCDARAVAGLIRETQIKREDVVLIGVRCGGVRAPTRRSAASALVRPRRSPIAAPAATAREPHLADHLVGELPPAPPAATRRDARIAELEAMTPAERWAFWQQELERCVRCHACREVCPMCFCERCVADKTQPQWIESLAAPARQPRLAPDARAAPGRPLRRLRRVRAGLPGGHPARAAQPQGRAGRGGALRLPGDATIPPCRRPIGSYQLDDAQEFIL